MSDSQFPNSQPATVGPADSDLLLTVAEACARLRIGKGTLYDLIRTGRLATLRIGRRRLIPTKAVGAMIDRLQAEESA